MTTIHDMAKHPEDPHGEQPTEKSEIAVNGFKAPPEWYEAVKEVAKARRSTIGGAILHLVELGMPIYEAMQAAERDRTLTHANRPVFVRQIRLTHPPIESQRKIILALAILPTSSLLTLH